MQANGAGMRFHGTVLEDQADLPGMRLQKLAQLQRCLHSQAATKIGKPGQSDGAIGVADTDFTLLFAGDISKMTGGAYRQIFRDDGPELVQAERSRILFAIDKESLRSGYIASLSIVDIRCHALLKVLAVEIGGKPGHIQIEALRLAQEVIPLDVALIGKDEIVHFPEFSLAIRRQRGAVRELGIGMERKGETLEHPPDLARVLGHQLNQRRRRFGAEGALHVRKLDDCDRRVFAAAHRRTGKVDILGQSDMLPGFGQRDGTMWVGEGAVNRKPKAIHGLLSVQSFAVNKECRRSGDTQFSCCGKVFLNRRLVVSSLQALLKQRHVEIEAPRVIQQVLRLQFFLIGVQQRVHFPESSLLACSQRSLVRQQGIMVERQGHVLEDELNFSGKTAQGFFQGWNGGRAKRTLIIKELDYLDGSSRVIDELLLPGSRRLVQAVLACGRLKRLRQRPGRGKLEKRERRDRYPCAPHAEIHLFLDRAVRV